MATPHTYTIQEVSALSGLPESTLRYYEQIDIIPPIDRDPSSKHRVYTERDVDGIVAIACLNATGMSIDTMREYISNIYRGKKAAAEQIALLVAHQKHLAEEEAYLKLRREYVKLKIDYWEAEKASDAKKVASIMKKASTLAKKLKDNKKQN